MTVAFIACVERGTLEAQAILLAESIRTFGGRWANAPIHTYQPRLGTDIAQQTLHTLLSLGCAHETLPLNTTHASYAIGNKMFVCAHAEESLDVSTLVFIDTDTVFVNEPLELDLPESVDAAVRPVDRKGWGSRGPGDETEAYWRHLYELCGVENEPFVETTIDRERIRAYFNAGLVAVRRASGVFREWRDCFLRLSNAAHLPPNPDFADQMALAAVLSRRFDRVRMLDERYNYPLPLRGISRSPLASAQLSNLVHLHYHQWFQRPNFLRDVRPPLDQRDPICRWLSDRGRLMPVIDIEIPCDQSLSR